jgi:hypothetical protein
MKVVAYHRIDGAHAVDRADAIRICRECPFECSNLPWR